MGKSWLLKELARRLSQKETFSSKGDLHSILTEASCLVGIWESMGQSDDLLSRVAVDLYSRWLSDSTYRQGR
jgi:hypothetical protein